MKTETLVRVVSNVLPAVDSKGLVSEFQYLYFSKTHVEATDGSLWIRSELDEESPEFAVLASTFYSLLKTITAKEIDIKVEAGKVFIKAGRVKSELALPEKSGFNAIGFDVEKWDKLPDGLIEGLGLCRFTACPDQTAGALTGVRVEGKTILSCDRFRISVYDMKKKLSAITVPIELIDQMQRFCSDIEGYSVVDDMFYINAGKVKVACKLLPGEFPSQSLLSSVKELQEGEELVLTNELKKAISEAGKRHNIIQDKLLEFDREAEFSVAEGKVRLFAQNETVGLVDEEIDYPEAKDLKFVFHINPLFLLRTFQQTDSMLYSEKNAVVSFKGANFTHLVKTKMPEGEE